MLSDPKEARAGINEIHFLPFNPVEKCTAITFTDTSGNWHRISKGAPEQIIEICNLKEDVSKRAHSIINKFAERGIRSLAVAQHTVPEKTKESPGGPWEFVGLLPLFDPPRHDSAETIHRALHLDHKDEVIAHLPVEELIETSDGFVGVFPEHKYEIVKKLQERKHICGMTGDVFMVLVGDGLESFGFTTSFSTSRWIS
ncbi:hypothetical protein POM88_014795 [Heracleum sosnowskyi]|uniref:Uncharacterized protein n=1 Tax=Heracleum sosnowskyi TaxID=360622 RepID=A0AAD8IIW7_9APIA|nr:hypothetical protein POM88_014795 [Heracleum sosnowskyi]